MHNYKIIIEYDGTNFVGWQYQKNGVSIQGILEKILSTEASLLGGYLLYLHQNQNLNNLLRIDP